MQQKMSAKITGGQKSAHDANSGWQKGTSQDVKQWKNQALSLLHCQAMLG